MINTVMAFINILINEVDSHYLEYKNTSVFSTKTIKGFFARFYLMHQDKRRVPQSHTMGIIQSLITEL